MRSLRLFWSAEDGFSLIEVAIALAIVGCLWAGLMPLVTHWRHMHATHTTTANQERIFSALAVFAKQTGRLPCPSDPEDLANWGLERKRCQSVREFFGAVPFKTLGLSERVARDGANTLFTYGVHPQMTLKRASIRSGRTHYCSQPVEPIFQIGSQANFTQKHHDPVVVLLFQYARSDKRRTSKGHKLILDPSWSRLGMGQSTITITDELIERAMPDKRSVGNQPSPRRVRFETKYNLAAYYGHLFCDPETRAKQIAR